MRSAPDTIDTIILELWREVSRGETFASKAVAAVFAAEPDLSAREREQIVTALYGMLSHARRIDHVLAAGGRQEFKTPALAYLLAWRVLEEGLTPARAASQVADINWAEVAASSMALRKDSDPLRRIGIGHSLPDFLAEKIVAQHGAEADALGRTLTERAPLVLRVNTLQASRDEVLEQLTKAGVAARPTHLAATGIILEQHADIFASPLYAAGTIEIQDEGSQAVVELVAPPPHGLVIDYCAGAGGKTLALGALMRNEGRLIGTDVSKRKLDELKRRARRAGVSNARTMALSREGEWPPELRALAGKAERVLVDAPCSGIGAFRRKPEMRWRLSAEDLQRLPEIQFAIAQQAMELCAPGGRLIYSTCTLLAEENERVVERLLANPAFELVAPKEILGKAAAAPIVEATGRYVMLLPHRHNTDGFFAAVLRRKRKA